MGDVFTFGPFLLDTGARRLLRDGTPVDLPPIQFALLQSLVEHAGHTVTKEELIATGWHRPFIEDNTLAKTMLRLRRTMDPADPTTYIATAAGHGYRFSAAATRVAVPSTGADVHARLAPYRAFVDGRVLLETLDRDNIPLARQLFEQAVQRDPHEAANHVGVASACLLQYEATRMDLVPDLDLLQRAEAHAEEACRLNGAHAEAHATLGFIRHRRGAAADASAALRRAVALEDGNWRHHARLGWVSWGEERLAAARRALAIVPHPLAYLLAASVAIARGDLVTAERMVDEGRALMAPDGFATSRYAVVGLDLVKGLLCLTRGARDEGLEAIARESAREASGHLFAREYAAHACYAMGACHVQAGGADEARQALGRALALAPRHVMARGVLLLVDGRVPDAAPADADPSAAFEVALKKAVGLVAGHGTAAAAGLIADALTLAPPGSTGWMIPIDPLLGVSREPAVWARVLAVLRERAL